MNWSEAQRSFRLRYGEQMSWKEYEVMTDYPRVVLDIAGLWSWRGEIWAKYAGSYPEPDEVGLEADHSFFKPGLVTEKWGPNQKGQIVLQGVYRHGRKIRSKTR